MNVKVSSSVASSAVMAFDKVMSEPATLNRNGLSVLERRFRVPKTIASDLFEFNPSPLYDSRHNMPSRLEEQ